MLNRSWRSVVAVFALVGCTVVVVGLLAAPSEKRPRYVGLPERFHLPAPEKELDALIRNIDVRGQRAHAWKVFSALTSPTDQGVNVYETWYTKVATFAVEPGIYAPQLLQAGVSRRAQQALGAGFHPDPPLAEAAVSDILFNRPAYNWIRKNGLYRKANLTAINDKFPPVSKWQDRSVPFPPNSAVVLKVVYWPIRKTGFTPLPVWDFTPANPVSPDTPQPINPPTTWLRVVAVTSMHVGKHETVPIQFDGREFKANVVPLRDLHHIKLDETQARQLRENPFFMMSVKQVFGPDGTIEAGDSVAVIAMHFTTAETDNWIWGTMWYHDQPNDGPYALDRPPSMRGSWRNYLMATTWDFYTPREADGSPDITYNPYIEGIDANGISSNCISCHSRAMWPAVCSADVTRGLNDPLYNKQVFSSEKDPAYDGTRTQLAFLWAIYFESDPKVPELKPAPPCVKPQAQPEAGSAER